MTKIYGIIESFGRQFWVEPNKFQDVSNFKLLKTPPTAYTRHFRLKYSNNSQLSKIIFFDRLMLFNQKNDTLLGRPFLNDFRVEGSILPGIRKKSKLLIFKMRAKKRFRRRIGFKISSRRIRFDNILKISTSKIRSDLQFLLPGTITK
jgi:ribosomal protein L21